MISVHSFLVMSNSEHPLFWISSTSFNLALSHRSHHKSVSNPSTRRYSVTVLTDTGWTDVRTDNQRTSWHSSAYTIVGRGVKIADRLTGQQLGPGAIGHGATAYGKRNWKLTTEVNNMVSVRHTEKMFLKAVTVVPAVLLLTTGEAAWCIILVVSVCLSACLSDDNFRKPWRIGSLYLHVRHISMHCGSSS